MIDEDDLIIVTAAAFEKMMAGDISLFEPLTRIARAMYGTKDDVVVRRAHGDLPDGVEKATTMLEAAKVFIQGGLT